MATAKFTNGLTHTSMEEGHVWMIMTAMIAAALSICTLSFFICLMPDRANYCLAGASDSLKYLNIFEKLIFPFILIVPPGTFRVLSFVGIQGRP